jgi:hypothetical protein
MRKKNGAGARLRAGLAAPARRWGERCRSGQLFDLAMVFHTLSHIF